MESHRHDKLNAIRNADAEKDYFFNYPLNSQVRGNRWVSWAITIFIAIIIMLIATFLLGYTPWFIWYSNGF